MWCQKASFHFTIHVFIFPVRLSFYVPTYMFVFVPLWRWGTHQRKRSGNTSCLIVFGQYHPLTPLFWKADFQNESGGNTTRSGCYQFNGGDSVEPGGEGDNPPGCENTWKELVGVRPENGHPGYSQRNLNVITDTIVVGDRKLGVMVAGRKSRCFKCGQKGHIGDEFFPPLKKLQWLTSGDHTSTCWSREEYMKQGNKRK